MRRFLTWAAGAAGGLAAYRFLSRRPQPAAAAPEQAAPEVDPRAAELRAKLNATREPDPPSDNVLQGEDEAETPEARRARVHEHGRSAVDEMRRSE